MLTSLTTAQSRRWTSELGGIWHSLKVDWSDWATPIVLVITKGKNWCVRICRYCMQYPLTVARDTAYSAVSLATNRRHSLTSGRYSQMEVEESSRKFLTINTHKGLYQYNRLVFGVVSAPAVWQTAMDLLQDIPETQCYLDDILVTGKNNEEHLQNLSKELHGVWSAGKMWVFQEQNLMLCHDMSLTNMANLAAVLHPLNALLQKWEWSEKCEKAFKETNNLRLTYPLWSITAHPSGMWCATLWHTMADGSERPIAFASRSLISAECNYVQIDREALSLVWDIKKFHHYLYGQKFTLVTNHQCQFSAPGREFQWLDYSVGHFS